MKIFQWQRAQFIIEQMKAADQANIDIVTSRSKIKRKTELKYKQCHDCLLLAVYGLYKNGFIKDTNRAKASEIDLVGFNGQESLDIRHAFDSLDLLRKDADLTAAELKRQLGGEQSIYSFVGYYFREGFLRL